MDLEELKRLYSEPTKKEGLDVAQVLEMQRIAAKLEDINLEQLLAKKEQAKTAMDRYVEALEQNKSLTRKLKGSPAPKRKKQHWRKRKAKYRQWVKEVGMPRRRAKRAELLKSPQGWYSYLQEGWKKKKVEVVMTEQEWVEVVWPALSGRLFVIQRYKPEEPISLYNVYILDTADRRCLYDGKEQKLRTLGYIL